MKTFSKVKRQFNYLSKKINRLLASNDWSTLSSNQQRKLISRLKGLYSRVQTMIPSTQMAKTLGTAAILLSANSLVSAQTFGPVQTTPFGLTGNGAFVTTTMIDIDNDGDQDLFQGDYNGNTHYYQNTGSNTAPAFAAVVNNPFGISDVGDLNNHAFVDIDNDGDFDLFMGDGANLPDIYFFENTGTATSPAFGITPTVNPFGIVQAAYNRHPVFVDIDNDGDQDLFFGELYGNIHYYENTGTVSAPVFSTHVNNPFGLADLGHSFTPAFVDIDGDGDMDLFSGEYNGDIKFFENTGTVSSPAFAAVQTNPFNLTTTGGYMSTPFLTDIDNDGDADLFVGIHSGNTHYYENTTASAVQTIFEGATLEVFPNPAQDYLQIHTEGFEKLQDPTLVIYSSLGKQVAACRITDNHQRYAINDLPNGSYFYSIQSANQMSPAQKLIILK